MHGKPTVLMYSHDSYGLGHLRRTLALAKAFVEHDPGLGVLILTGSTVSNTRVVKFFSSWPLVRDASLVAVSVLLCFGVLPSWAAFPKSDVSPAALTMVDSLYADQVANGYGDVIDGNYLPAFAAEAEASDKLPRNAAVLTALLLVGFFGTIIGWLLALGWPRRRSRIPLLIGCCFPSIGRRHQRRPVAALLEVFRL